MFKITKEAKIDIRSIENDFTNSREPMKNLSL